MALGTNFQDKTSPIQKQYNRERGFDPNESCVRNTIHAECHALSKIRDMDLDWSKVSVFVYRAKKDGSKGMARPCKACEAMLRNMGIKEIYYSTDTGFAHETYD